MKKIIIIASVNLLLIQTPIFADTIGTIKQVINASKNALIKPNNIKSIMKEATIDGLEAAGKEAVAITIVTPALTTGAVAGAGYIGATASTGTAIASLGGAAATSATLGAIGTTVLGAVGVTVASPAVAGVAIVGGVASAIVWGVSSLWEDD